MRAVDGRGRVSWVTCAVVAALLGSACGRLPAGVPAAAATPTPLASASALILCNPAAADYQKAGTPTPAPCISVNPDQQIEDNLSHLQRRMPQPADAAALAPAASDLGGVFSALRAQGVYDVAAVQQAGGAYPSLRQAHVHAPRSEKLTTVDARVVVVLEHGTACLMGEHGPTRSVVYVVGETLDGGCEALYGH